MIKLIKSTILLFYWISLYLNLTSFQLSLKYYFVCYVYLSWILGAFWALTKACVWFFVTCCFDNGKNTFSSKYLFFPPLCDVSGFFLLSFSCFIPDSVGSASPNVSLIQPRLSLPWWYGFLYFHHLLFKCSPFFLLSSFSLLCSASCQERR